MLTRFTKGPWHWDLKGALGFFGIYSNEEVLWPAKSEDPNKHGELCEANHVSWWRSLLGSRGPHAEANAPWNAALIAASPELYEALAPFAEDGADLTNAQCHLGICRDWECGRCSKVIAARNALRRARGELQ